MIVKIGPGVSKQLATLVYNVHKQSPSHSTKWMYTDHAVRFQCSKFITFTLKQVRKLSIHWYIMATRNTVHIVQVAAGSQLWVYAGLDWPKTAILCVSACLFPHMPVCVYLLLMVHSLPVEGFFHSFLCLLPWIMAQTDGLTDESAIVKGVRGEYVRDQVTRYRSLSLHIPTRGLGSEIP